MEHADDETWMRHNKGTFHPSSGLREEDPASQAFDIKAVVCFKRTSLTDSCNDFVQKAALLIGCEEIDGVGHLRVEGIDMAVDAIPTIKMCDCPVIWAMASAASMRSPWLMRFIDREGVSKRVAGVTLLHASILSEELLYDGFGGRV